MITDLNKFDSGRNLEDNCMLPNIEKKAEERKDTVLPTEGKGELSICYI